MAETNHAALSEQVAKLREATEQALKQGVASVVQFVKEAEAKNALDNARLNEAISPKLNDFTVKHCESDQAIIAPSACAAAKEVVKGRGK